MIRRTVALLLFVSAPAAAQQIPLRELPKSKEMADPFSVVMSAVEIRPGQLIVADPTETEVTLVDFLKGTRTVIGRRGAGPGEYTNPAGIVRLPGDTTMVLDLSGGNGMSGRAVMFLPDFKPGTTSTLMTFNMQDTTVMQGTMFADNRGQLYSTAIKLKMGATGAVPTDTMYIVRFEPRSDATFTKLASIRTPQTGNREQLVEGTNIKVKVPFPGLVKADAWTVFPDGRVAIIRGATYTIEFLNRDGTKTAPVAVPYEHIKVTPADREAELAQSKRQLNDLMVMIKKSMPPSFTIEIEIVPPPSWPAEYPPVAALVAFPAPNGDVWVRRSVPARLDREQWDVINRSGRLVGRWQLPPKTTLVAIGQNAVYTVRKDEDDLRYVQRVELPPSTAIKG